MLFKILFYVTFYTVLTLPAFAQIKQTGTLNIEALEKTDKTWAKLYDPDKVLYESPIRLHTWSISFTAGLPKYHGALPAFNFSALNDTIDKPGKQSWIGYSLGVQKQLTYLLGIELRHSYGKLRGSGYYGSFSYFKTKYNQTDLKLLVNLKGLLLTGNKMPHWKIDAYSGIGHAIFSSTAYNTANSPGQTFNKKSALVMPTGISASYELTPRIDVGIDVSLNKVFSDKFNASASGDSVLKFIQIQGPGAGTKVYKESPRRNFYSMLGLNVTYKFGDKIRRRSRKLDIDKDKGIYHLRYADFRNILSPYGSISFEQADSIAKANMPKPVDPRLYLDSDGDGVADLFDKDPDTPPGVPVSGSGTILRLDDPIKSALGGNLVRVSVSAKIQSNPKDLKKYIIPISDGNIQGLTLLPEQRTNAASYENMVRMLRSYNHSPKNSSNEMFSILEGSYYVILMSDCDYQRYELEFSTKGSIYTLDRVVKSNCK